MRFLHTVLTGRIWVEPHFLVHFRLRHATLSSLCATIHWRMTFLDRRVLHSPCAISLFYATSTGLPVLRVQRSRCFLCILAALPFAFYSDERVLFVFGICFLHLELEGSMRDSSLLLLCVYSKSSFSASLFCVFASLLSQLLYIPDLIWSILSTTSQRSWSFPLYFLSSTPCFCIWRSGFLFYLRDVECYRVMLRLQ